ncbi:hypothetical protein [Streptococcus sp. E17BB]|uniref:hypothetical protein n=1 Tax=Streptococcus sp. E17BB TaxID=3278714 RepID=UPI00359D4F0F
MNKRFFAQPQTPSHKAFWRTIAELYKAFITLELVDEMTEQISPNKLTLIEQTVDYQPTFRLTASTTEQFIELPNLTPEDWDISTSLALASYLMTVGQPEQLHWLDKLPLHAAITDQDNHLIYHNQKPKDPFFFDELEQTPVEDWLIQEVLTKPEHAVHLLLPATSFDQILIQSYQGLYDNNQFQGIFQQVQDIKPMLASYLAETGQAIVGWSDTTSGASIKNNLFDEEAF